MLLTLLKFYHHLHPLFKVESSFLYKIAENKKSLDIFQMVVGTNKLVKEFFNRKLLIFCKYQMDVKDIECLLKCWRKHETMFPIVGFLVRKILGIVGFQIKIEKFFSIVEIFANLKRCHLQLNNLEK